MREVVDHDNLVGVQTVHLVSQQVGALLVGIIRYNEAFALLGDEFEQLGRFGAWGSAHVEDGVVWLNIKKVRREHRHDFLSAQEPCVVCLCDKFLAVLELRLLFQQLSWDGEFVKQAAWPVVFFAS